ncbi:MAG: NADP oxidoreductase, partial [Bacteroidales bacterium]
MDAKKLNKVDLIFDKEGCNALEVLDKALERSPDDIINDMIDSGLKGRGGAGFPTGLKWKFTRAEDDPVKYVICNADEGEPGTFKDREILEQVPGKVFTGMAIAAHAIGAKKGFIYVRAE